MRVRTIDVIIPVWRHGREIVASLRSTQAAMHGFGHAVRFGVILVAHDVLAERMPEAAERHTLLTAPTDVPCELIAAGCAASEADLVVILEAGNHLSARFLSALTEGELGERRIWCPDTVVTFGQRTGTARQPGYIPGSPLGRRIARRLAHEIVWESTLAGPPSLLVGAFREAGAAGIAAASAALIAAEIEVVAVPDAATFVRWWTPHQPRVHVGPLLSRTGLLSSVALSATEAHEIGALADADRWGQRWLRRARHFLMPWIHTLAAVQRRWRAPGRFSPVLLEQWLDTNRYDALVPFPRPDVAVWAEDWDATSMFNRAEIDAYWWVRQRLGPSPDYVMFAPWIRTGGGDSVLIQYIQSIRRQDPEATIAVVTTEPVRSTRLADLPSHVAVVELRELLERGIHRDALVGWIVPQILGQLCPRVVHAFNSTVAYDVVERFGERLSDATGLFLSTFAFDRSPDGESLSVLLLRRPGFLDPVRAVLVDSQQFVDRAVRELGYERSRFVVQRNVVEVPLRQRSTPRHSHVSGSLQVLWAGRFDLPKRLDVLASLAEAVQREELPVAIHFYGLEVMGAPELAGTLERLEKAGAIRHPPFAHFADLDTDDIDVYVLTSEWEGIPLSILEAMAAGIPVAAPLVGGVGEVLDDTSGFVIDRFDDVEGYVRALRSILADEADALARAAVARDRIERNYSSDAFDARLRALPGYLRDS